MTMGPDPISRIFLMSVRLGMCLVSRSGAAARSSPAQTPHSLWIAPGDTKGLAARPARWYHRPHSDHHSHRSPPMSRRLILLAVLVTAALGCGKKTTDDDYSGGSGGITVTDPNATYTLQLREPQAGDKFQVTMSDSATFTLS